MNHSRINTVQATVRNGSVLFFGAVFEVPPELHVLLEGSTVQVDYYVRDASGVRLRTQGDDIVCWAPQFGAPDTPQSPPVSPASTATERQSHTDGPSAQAVPGGHPELRRALATIERRNEQFAAAIAALNAQQALLDDLIAEQQELDADGDTDE